MGLPTGSKGVPRREVVQVLLDHQVAAAGEFEVVLADEGGGMRRLPIRVLRAIDEAEQVPVIEEAETLHLVHRGDRALQPDQYLRRQLEAQVQPARRVRGTPRRPAWRPRCGRLQ